ncbi:hypothetical protein D9757_003946 [Collybiopsis confluens]|uniref:Uncharacterized protein n=1 Tax=Collybiopsis confluens TaxID=2823264 RepID=A0A8H5HXI6_9AGAR|nr:hypothetical protein D9757_003946 [Collybiopsis confluens]
MALQQILEKTANQEHRAGYEELVPTRDAKGSNEYCPEKKLSLITNTSVLRESRSITSSVRGSISIGSNRPISRPRRSVLSCLNTGTCLSSTMAKISDVVYGFSKGCGGREDASPDSNTQKPVA